MKSFNILLVLIVLIVSCKDAKSTSEKSETTSEAVKYTAYGDEIQSVGAISQSDMWKSYKKLTVSDTLSSKFKGTVAEVCQAKGCWMKLKLEDGQEAMVKFKDYGFFMPKDAGKSEAELALILEPKKTYSFKADGVLIKQ
jgi:hypothetical protein